MKVTLVTIRTHSGWLQLDTTDSSTQSFSFEYIAYRSTSTREYLNANA